LETFGSSEATTPIIGFSVVERMLAGKKPEHSVKLFRCGFSIELKSVLEICKESDRIFDGTGFTEFPVEEGTERKNC